MLLFNFKLRSLSVCFVFILEQRFYFKKVDDRNNYYYVHFKNAVKIIFFSGFFSSDSARMQLRTFLIYTIVIINDFTLHIRINTIFLICKFSQ